MIITTTFGVSYLVKFIQNFQNQGENHLHLHAHCDTCVHTACNYGEVDYCNEVIKCKLECGHSFHKCKEAEHELLCKNGKVECINSGYGCPAVLKRSNLGGHLEKCPASMVVCHKQWRRRASPRENCPNATNLDLVSTIRDENVLTSAFQIQNSNVRNGLPGHVLEFNAGEQFHQGRTFKRPTDEFRTTLENRLYSVNEKLNMETGKEFVFTCGKEFRRDEIEHHLRDAHGAIHEELDGLLFRKCHNSLQGCNFSIPRLHPINHEYKICYNPATDALCVERTNLVKNGQDENMNQSGVFWDSKFNFSNMPDKIMQHILKYLDPQSLNCLSMTNTRMRGLCKTVLESRGMVAINWQKISDDPVEWKPSERKWLFSTAISPIRNWKMNNLSALEKHAKDCQYQDNGGISRNDTPDVNSTIQMVKCRHCRCDLPSWACAHHEEFCQTFKILNKEYELWKIARRHQQRRKQKLASTYEVKRKPTSLDIELRGLSYSWETEPALFPQGNIR